MSAGDGGGLGKSPGEGRVLKVLAEPTRLPGSVHIRATPTRHSSPAQHSSQHVSQPRSDTPASAFPPATATLHQGTISGKTP